MEEFNSFSPILVYRKRKVSRSSKENREFTKLSLKSLTGHLSGTPNDKASNSHKEKKIGRNIEYEIFLDSSKGSLDGKLVGNLETTEKNYDGGELMIRNENRKAKNDESSPPLSKNACQSILESSREIELSLNDKGMDCKRNLLYSLENLKDENFSETVKAIRNKSLTGDISTKSSQIKATNTSSSSFECKIDSFNCSSLGINLEKCSSNIPCDNASVNKSESSFFSPFGINVMGKNSIETNIKKCKQKKISQNEKTFSSSEVISYPSILKKDQDLYPSLMCALEYDTFSVPQRTDEISNSKKIECSLNNDSTFNSESIKHQFNSTVKEDCERKNKFQHSSFMERISSSSNKLRTKMFLDIDSSENELSPPPLSERLQVTPKFLKKLPNRFKECGSPTTSSSTSGSEEFEAFLHHSLKKSTHKKQDKKSSFIKHSIQNEMNNCKKSTSEISPKGVTCLNRNKKLVTHSTAKSFISPTSKASLSVYATIPKYCRLKKVRQLVESTDDSSDIEDEVFSSPSLKSKDETSRTSKITNEKSSVCSIPSLTFLATLSSNASPSLGNQEGLYYKRNFAKAKCDLVKKLFDMFNEEVFGNKLPSDMSITWNPRMRKTAGFCYYKLNPSTPLGRSARIELSSKVIDSAERLRDTLIHEMCHAASWMIHGYRDGHGPLWKFWAQQANKIFPEIPTITRCHTYKINTKYVYKCSRCGGCIGRHSKSLDITRKVCGSCGGKFELLVNGKSDTSSASKTPSGFALFVKENYGSVKKSSKSLKHSDVMKMLSKDFHEKNKI